MHLFLGEKYLWTTTFSLVKSVIASHFLPQGTKELGLLFNVVSFLLQDGLEHLGIGTLARGRALTVGEAVADAQDVRLALLVTRTPRHHHGRRQGRNLEDDLGAVADCDWIIEAVIERLDIKRDLYRRLDAVRKPGAVVSSNTLMHYQNGSLIDTQTRAYNTALNRLVVGEEISGAQSIDMQVAAIILLMIMPLVTMRSIAEEKRNRSLTLLISAPLSISEIVLGQFCGLMLFVLVLVSMLNSRKMYPKEVLSPKSLGIAPVILFSVK